MNYKTNQQIVRKLFYLINKLQKGKLIFQYDTSKSYFDVIIYNKNNIGMYACLLYVNKPDIEESFERINEVILFINNN